MSDRIAFYHNPLSRGRIVHWMLEEVGAPYDIKLLSFDKGEHKSPAYLAVNPMGKVPAIVHRGVVITECAAICAYLADLFPKAGLAPAVDDPARGSYLRWMFFGAGCFEPAMLDHLLKRPPVERTSALGWGTYEDTMATLEQALTPGPFLLGKQFSAADVFVGSQVSWGMMSKGIEPRPAFQQYLAALGERPAYQRVMAESEKLAGQMKQAAG